MLARREVSEANGRGHLPDWVLFRNPACRKGFLVLNGLGAFAAGSAEVLSPAAFRASRRATPAATTPRSPIFGRRIETTGPRKKKRSRAAFRIEAPDWGLRRKLTSASIGSAYLSERPGPTGITRSEGKRRGNRAASSPKGPWRDSRQRNPPNQQWNSVWALSTLTLISTDLATLKLPCDAGDSCSSTAQTAAVSRAPARPCSVETV